jgi:hypothetical protein
MRCCIGCIVLSPKKDNSAHGTFVQNVGWWTDYSEVWTSQEDKRSRPWYVNRVGLPPDRLPRSIPLCHQTTSACLNVDFRRKRRSPISKPFPGGRVEAYSVFSLYRTMTPPRSMELPSTSDDGCTHRVVRRTSIQFRRLDVAFLTSSPHVYLNIPRQAPILQGPGTTIHYDDRRDGSNRRIPI